MNFRIILALLFINLSLGAITQEYQYTELNMLGGIVKRFLDIDVDKRETCCAHKIKRDGLLGKRCFKVHQCTHG